MPTIGSFRISRSYYSYSICLVVKRDGCQFNMSTNVSSFVFRLSLKAGAKLKLLFVSRKKNLKFFLEFFNPNFLSFPYQSLNELPRFAGCKCNIRFQISQAFWNLFFFFISKDPIPHPVSISVNAFACCGCKSTTFIYIYNAFCCIFSMFFPPFP